MKKLTLIFFTLTLVAAEKNSKFKTPFSTKSLFVTDEFDLTSSISQRTFLGAMLIYYDACKKISSEMKQKENVSKLIIKKKKQTIKTISAQYGSCLLNDYTVEDLSKELETCKQIGDDLLHDIYVNQIKIFELKRNIDARKKIDIERKTIFFQIFSYGVLNSSRFVTESHYFKHNLINDL